MLFTWVVPTSARLKCREGFIKTLQNSKCCVGIHCIHHTCPDRPVISIVRSQAALHVSWIISITIYIRKHANVCSCARCPLCLFFVFTHSPCQLFTFILSSGHILQLLHFDVFHRVTRSSRLLHCYLFERIYLNNSSSFLYHE